MLTVFPKEVLNSVVICGFRDSSIYEPVNYLVLFRGFTLNSAVKYLHKFWKMPFDPAMFECKTISPTK